MQASPFQAVWQAVEPFVVQALILLIPTAAAAAVAFVNAKRRQWESARAAVAEVELMASSNPDIRGETKTRLALNKLRQSAPGLSEPKARFMIEEVLPEVRRASERPPAFDIPVDRNAKTPNRYDD